MDSNASSNTLPPVEGDVNDDNEIKIDSHCRELDGAKFGAFHVRTILVSGAGFLTDAYDVFVISMVSPMLGYIYTSSGKLDSQTDGWLKASASWGTLIGQLLFGLLADKLGRKSMYAIVLMIIIAGTIGSSISGSTQAVSNVAMLAIWRVFLGIGIGGDYPISAVITAEFANSKRRGLMISAVFAMQGIGILLGALMTVIVLAAFKQDILLNPHYYLDIVWRLVIAIGCIPESTSACNADVLGQKERAAADARHVLRENRDRQLLTGINTYKEKVAVVENKATNGPTFAQHFGEWKNLKVLIGASVTWFCLDVAFYGTNLNTPIILKAIGYGSGPTVFDQMWNIAVGNLIVALLGAVPGYWFTVGLVERMGRKTIQIMGFTILTILFAILAGCYTQISAHPAVFVFLYTLVQFFNNFGPNATTFVIAAECFPTRFRTTAHGIAAASGKAGAILAAQGFSLLKDNGGAAGSNAFVYGLLWIFSGFMLVGLLFTFLVPETKGKSLEELSNGSEM